MVMHQLTNSLLHIDIISVAFLCVTELLMVQKQSMKKVTRTLEMRYSKINEKPDLDYLVCFEVLIS